MQGEDGAYLMAKREVEDYNASIGDLPDYDCKFCNNKGYVASMTLEGVIYQKCPCHNIRKEATLLRLSGIKETQRLASISPEPWQKEMCVMAKDFLDNPKGWLYFGGQVGSGKTMIATAIVNELLIGLTPCRYMLWRDAIVELKACVTDAEYYKALIGPLKTVKVLYIDDLFKTEKGKAPTQADINLAFELINARYNDPELITIITSELALEELLDIDEAVGSRIYQRAKDHYCYVEIDSKKNFRLR